MSVAETEAASGGAARAGVVYLVGGGPGDPGLLTLRGAELLSSADVVLHDELVHPALLERARAGADVRAVGKRGGGRVAKQASQGAIEAELVAQARGGRAVVRLKGGDPFLFGRGSEEAEALVRAGVPFEVVPGIPSPLAAAAYGGLSLTHRDLASSVTFVSATTRAGAPFDWTELASLRGTVCVLMGMRSIEATCAGLLGGARREPATPAAVVQWATRPEQRVVVGRLDELAARSRAAGLGSPAVIVVGTVVELRGLLRWFDARPLFGKRVLVTRPRGQASATAGELRRRGAEPIELPAISLEAPPDAGPVRRAVAEAHGYDLVAFTSANGVDWFWRALEAEGRDARALGGALVAAVGPGTAAALRDRGVRADLVPVELRGDALAEAILADPRFAERVARGGARVLLLRALVAREVLPERLRAAGVDVDVVAVYETRPAPASVRDALLGRLAAGGVDAVLLTAGSTADSLCALVGPRAAELLAPVVIASIGPVTTATAQRLGLAVSLTAEPSTTEALLDALERHFAARAAKEP